MKTFKLYKIRNKQTGKYSSGGYSPRWSRSGKVWKSRSGLTQHLRHQAHAEAWKMAIERVGTYNNTDWKTYSDWYRAVKQVREEIMQTRRLIPEDWEVVEIEVREENTRTFDPNDLVGGAVG